MRKLPILLLPISMLGLAGCGHISSLAKDAFHPTPTTVCNPVVPPPPDPLENFTFYPLTAGTKAADGTQLQAGVTSDGIKAILDNHATLQKREQEWQGRASAVNNCLGTEVKQAQNAGQ